MKRLLILTLAIATSGILSANDGGVAVVEVNSLEINSDSQASVATFKGSDATEFMKILPAQSWVLSSVVPNFNDNFKALTIGTKNREGFVSIVCQSGELFYFEELPFNEKPLYEPYEHGPECSITISKGTRYSEGDEERFNADEMVLKKKKN